MQYKRRQIISTALTLTILVAALALFGIVMTGAASAQQPAPVSGDVPQDTDCDGFYEDVNADGDVGVVDVQAMFANLDSIESRDDATMFDINEDGGIDVVDVQAMFAGLNEGSDTRLDLCKVEQRVHHYINEERADRGLSTLGYDTKVAHIARYHSDNMVENDDLYHESPGGEEMTDRYELFGYRDECNSRAENVAYRTYSSDDTEDELARGIVNQWMGSEGHKDNILKPYWNNEGLGVGTTSDGEIYVTQNFC